jgi:hypothetical protein
MKRVGVSRRSFEFIERHPRWGGTDLSGCMHDLLNFRLEPALPFFLPTNSLSYHPHDLVDGLEERYVTKAALDLRPFTSCSHIEKMAIVLERLMKEANEYHWDFVTSADMLCELLQHVDIPFSGISCRVFKQLTELVDHKEDTLITFVTHRRTHRFEGRNDPSSIKRCTMCRQGK